MLRISRDFTSLTTNQTPCSTSILALGKLTVEPALLSGTHHTTSGVVADLMDVVRVPVKIGDGSVVLPGVEHDQIEKTSDGETPPDT